MDTYVYLTDKSEALEKALESLKFYYGTKKGSAQSRLTKVTEGKEVSPNSVDDVKSLLQDLEQLSAFAEATGEASFLELEATVVTIVKKRFSQPIKTKFAEKSKKAEDKGENINVAFVISFLRDYYANINRVFGMGFLSTPNVKSSSS